MVIHQKNHQNNILYVSKCIEKEAHFVDFYTIQNYLFLKFLCKIALSLLEDHLLQISPQN